MKFSMQINVDLWKSDIIKYETGSSIASPYLPSLKSIRGHTVTAGGPIWMKFDSLM